jgi:hypothetical protein
MMGIQGTPARLFYDFCLEEHVPVDHVLRGIDRHLALDDLRQSRFGIKPAFLAADSAYGSAESLAWLVKRKEIAPHIPVFDKSNRTDGTFSRADFVFDAERDRYTCPAGKELVQFRRTYAIPRSGVTAEGTRLYRASKLDCDVCKLKAQCCPNALARKIPRDLDEDARRGPRARPNSAIRGGLSPTEENRDAVRSSQANPSPHALAPKGSERCKRRVPACSDRTKPETSRPLKTNQHPSGNAGRLTPSLPTTGRKQKQKHLPHQDLCPSRSLAKPGLFQRYQLLTDIGASTLSPKRSTVSTRPR